MKIFTGSPIVDVILDFESTAIRLTDLEPRSRAEILHRLRELIKLDRAGQ